MNFDFVNIITILSVIATVWCFICVVYEVRKEKNEQKNLKSKIEEYMSDYDRILKSTYELEKAREKNTGKHFDDEMVYLNRANEIRHGSPLFCWINEC